MTILRKNIYVSCGYSTVFFGPGRKEFDPKKPMRPFEEYLQETAEGTLKQIPNPVFDEGVIGSFMSGRFINQANLPGFLPFMVPSLLGKACLGVEGACGTGGKAIAAAAKGILADFSDSSFVAAFEMQNSIKSVYGADVLAGAGYYSKERKGGGAFFFPKLFSDRAAAYMEKYGEEKTRQAMAKWYEQSVLNARKNPKAQDYHNTALDLFSLGMTLPSPSSFTPCLNLYNCSKVSDGAASLALFSEEGLIKCGIDKKQALQIVGIGEAEGDITKSPEDLSSLSTTKQAVEKALEMAKITKDDLGILEIHDCFGITAILSFEAIGYARPGKGVEFILEGSAGPEGKIPTNASGGLTSFGHPTGASGVRQMADLFQQMTGQAAGQVDVKTPYGMMVSMGGNDKTVTCLIVKKTF